MNATIFSLFVSQIPDTQRVVDLNIQDKISQCDHVSYLPTMQPTQSPIAPPTQTPTSNPATSLTFDPTMTPTLVPSTAPTTNLNKSNSLIPTTIQQPIDENLQQTKLWIFVCIILAILLILSIIVSVLCHFKRKNEHYIRSPTNRMKTNEVNGTSIVDSDEEIDESIGMKQRMLALKKSTASSHASDYEISLPRKDKHGFTDDG